MVGYFLFLQLQPTDSLSGLSFFHVLSLAFETNSFLSGKEKEKSYHSSITLLVHHYFFLG